MCQCQEFFNATFPGMISGKYFLEQMKTSRKFPGDQKRVSSSLRKLCTMARSRVQAAAARRAHCASNTAGYAIHPHLHLAIQPICIRHLRTQEALHHGAVEVQAAAAACPEHIRACWLAIHLAIRMHPPNASTKTHRGSSAPWRGRGPGGGGLPRARSRPPRGTAAPPRRGARGGRRTARAPWAAVKPQILPKTHERRHVQRKRSAMMRWMRRLWSVA